MEAILCGRDGTVARMLKKNPKLANCEFHAGATNPVCRAVYLGHRNIVALLLKAGANVNAKSDNGRSALMWASWRDNIPMMELLLQHNADTQAVDNDGWNALDLAILRINFPSAKFLSRVEDPEFPLLKRRPLEDYEGHCWRKYDIQMMFDKIDADAPEVEYQRFFDKIRQERREWLAQDLVVDRREGYRDWIWRQLNFGEAPLVPREELPVHLQPQTSIRGKLVNYINGVDPRLPMNRNADAKAKKIPTQVDLESGVQDTESGDVEMQKREINEMLERADEEREKER